MPGLILLIIMTTYLILIILLLIINQKFNISISQKRKKMTPFECGFMPSTSPRLPFSLQFFIISLIFLIFDIEISIIIPFIYSMNIITIKNNIIIMSYFMTILIMGTLIEWLENSFNWIK